MFRRFLAHAIDEAFGVMLLHEVLRFGDRPPAAGVPLPELTSGDPKRFFSPVPEPADLTTHRRAIGRTAHAVVEDFAFVSPVSTAWPRNNVVRGREWRVVRGSGEAKETRDRGTEREGAVPPSPDSSDPPTPRTLVLIDGIVQFGYGNERLFADRLNPAGIDVVTIDLPFNHHRTPAGYRPGQLIVGGDIDHMLGVFRQAVLDVWALVRGLQAEGRSVALAGISLGGWTVLATSLIATDLASVTAIAPPVDMFRVLTEGGVIVRAARRGLGLSSDGVNALRPMARAVTPSAWPCPLPPGRVFLHAAEYDRFVPPRRIYDLAERWQAHLTRYRVGHMQITSFPPWLKRIADSVRENAWSGRREPPRSQGRQDASR